MSIRSGPENSYIEVLPSAVRTTAQSIDLKNTNAKGVIVVLDVTVDDASASITLTIRAKDPTSGKYVDLLVAAAVAATGTTAYIVYPPIATAAGQVTKVVGYPLPLDWNVEVAVADADAITYSIGAQYIR
jgi:hypothetical protein